MAGWYSVFLFIFVCGYCLFIYTTGWRISDESIRTGLETTQLVGRSQFLTSVEAEALGVSGATILLDGGCTHADSFIHMSS